MFTGFVMQAGLLDLLLLYFVFIVVYALCWQAVSILSPWNKMGYK